MFFKLKNCLFVQYRFVASCVLVLCTSVLSPPGGEEACAAPLRLFESTASLAASGSSGVAAPGDASVIDLNPAALCALKKQYTLFAGGAWGRPGGAPSFFETGVFDSSTSVVAAVLRGRQTLCHREDAFSSCMVDRSLSLGLAYVLPFLNTLSVGLTFNYNQFFLEGPWSWGGPFMQNRTQLGFGLLQQIQLSGLGIPLFWGFGAQGLFDPQEPQLFDLGVSTVLWNGVYTFFTDLLWESPGGVKAAVWGLNLQPNLFFELRSHVGYNLKKAHFFGGGGLFLKAPILHLYYTLVKTNLDDTTLRQTTGVELSFSI